MKTNTKMFDNNRVRIIVDEDNKQHIVAKDIALALGYTYSSNLLRLVEDQDKGKTTVLGATGIRKMNIVSFTGIFSIAHRSTKPKAKALERWINEVIEEDIYLPFIDSSVDDSYNHELENNLKHYFHELADNLLASKSHNSGLSIDKVEIVVNCEVHPKTVVEKACALF